ncbi:hypothetical protein EVAR_9263_1 [Eumeta japonica]|uniref:Uncharacterized protein n=1 Tax=Eumeta variegata TaxID=151549 RepID=A0A4C1TNJ0_EUMVA|nr:hypothetical protein EVAR_9263_1 [Eumeta japonica]
MSIVHYNDSGSTSRQSIYERFVCQRTSRDEAVRAADRMLREKDYRVHNLIMTSSIILLRRLFLGIENLAKSSIPISTQTALVPVRSQFSSQADDRMHSRSAGPAEAVQALHRRY